MRSNRRCICCGKDVVSELTTVDFLTTGNDCLPSHYNIVGCDSCGACFADMEASQDDFNAYYSKYNNYAFDSFVKLSSIKNTPYEFISDMISQNYSKEQMILDVGFGGGEILQLLKMKGYHNLFGIDPSVHAVDAMNNIGISARVGNIFDNIDNNDLRKYDVVLSTFVMEHIYDVEGYIGLLQKYLKDTGNLILIVPAVEGFAKVYTPKPNYFNREHINYFSISSMDIALAKYSMKRTNEDFNNGNYKEEFLYGIYQYNSEPIIVEKDTVSMKSIKDYLSIWEEEKQKKKKIVEKLLTEESKIIAFGVGQYLEWFLVEYPEIVKKIVFCVDNNKIKQNTTFSGIPIYDVSKIEECKDAKVLICSMFHSDQIAKQIQALNIQNELVIL